MRKTLNDQVKNTIAVVEMPQGNCQLAVRGMRRSEALNGTLSELRWSITTSLRIYAGVVDTFSIYPLDVVS